MNPLNGQRESLPLLSRLRRALTFLGICFAVSVIGYKLLTDCDWTEAVYFTVITMSTVGYGEETTREAPVQIFTIAVILVGVMAGAYTFGLIVQTMIEGQFNKAFGVRRMNREIDQLSGHALICGYGRIGKTIAAELARRDKPFVIIDSDQSIVEQSIEEHQLVVSGDATDEEFLLQAGIKRASTLVIALKSDADNVFLTLTARNLNPNLRIIARGEEATTEKKLRQAGADQVVLPAVIGGRRMAALVTRPHAAELLEHFTNHESINVDLEELRIKESCDLVGKTVRETAARQKHDLLIVGIRRITGDMIFNPSADHVFNTDDTLVVMGKSTDINLFRDKMHLSREAGEEGLAL